MSTDDALLDAAAALLTRGSPLTVAAVAAAAGVSRAAVYRRFADRDALVDALVRTGRAAAPPPAEPDARERILDAVGAVLKRQGLAATTLEDVAREAGVGPVTVYRRFGDRAGLLRAFAAERSPRRLASTLPPGGTGDVEADLLALTRATIAFLREYRGLFELVYAQDPEARAIFAEAREGSPSVRGLYAQLVDRHFPDPTGRTGWLLYGMVTAVAWCGAGDPEDDAAFVVRSFLHGVRR